MMLCKEGLFDTAIKGKPSTLVGALILFFAGPHVTCTQDASTQPSDKEGHDCHVFLIIPRPKNDSPNR